MDNCVGKSFLKDKEIQYYHIFQLIYHSIPNLL